MLSDLPAGYVEVGVLLILDAVPAVQGIVWLVRLLKDRGRLKRNDALKMRSKVVGFQYEPYLQKTYPPSYWRKASARRFTPSTKICVRGKPTIFCIFPQRA